MPQTLQAFLAMFVVTLLSINQQRSVLQSYDTMLGQATEVMSSGVALQALEYITSRDFDQQVVGSNFVTSPSQLTSPSFTTGNNCVFSPTDPCDDLDDYHVMTPDTLRFDTPNGGFHNFAVSADVFYVDPTLNPDSMVTYQTYSKMVTVVVTDITNIMDYPVQISRLITCDAGDGCN